jgi:hypothetical protein
MSTQLTSTDQRRAGQAQQGANSAQDKKVIFKASAVAPHLSKLKAEAAAKAAANGGDEGRWWADVLKFDFTNVRAGANSTKWSSVEYTDENGVTARLLVRIAGEKHTGQIMPTTDAAVAELAAKIKNPQIKIEKRTRKPSLQIQKWRAQVKTAEDGVTILKDEAGNLLLPSDDKRSDYYTVASLVGEAFEFEINDRLNRGAALIAKANELKKQPAAKILAEFNATQPPRSQGDMILGDAQTKVLQKIFPTQSDIDTLIKGAIIVTNMKVASLVQETISSQSKKNAGCRLPNPMTRVAMNFVKDTGLAQLAFHDKGFPFTEGGKQKFEVAKVGADPINETNVHMFVLPRSEADGIVNMDSVCFSSMGISMPVKAELLLILKPKQQGVSADDFWEDDGSASAPASNGASSTAAATTTRSTSEPPAGAASSSEDYGDILDELAQ